MPQARVLNIAGGGSGAHAFNGGGGGAGGMQDTNITLENLTSYDVVVGDGADFPGSQSADLSEGQNSPGNKGGDSYIKKPNASLFTSQTFSLDIEDSQQCKQIDVSSIPDNSPLFIKVQGGGEPEDFATFSLEGNEIFGNGFALNGQDYYQEVYSLVSGKSSVEICGRITDFFGTHQVSFFNGSIIRSIGGGAGGRDGYDTDPVSGGGGGGSGGGGGGEGDDFPGDGGSFVDGQGNYGGTANGSGGGGGGAGSPGQVGDNGGNGGNGASSDITGSSVTYAGGGGSTGGNDGSGSDNYGGGGSASDQWDADGGEDGLVVIRYNPDNFVHEWTGGDNEYEVGGDKVIEFTTDGTLEPVLSGTAFFALD